MSASLRTWTHGASYASTGTIYLSAVFLGAGVNQTSFDSNQESFESLLSESVQDHLDASAIVLTTHSQVCSSLLPSLKIPARSLSYEKWLNGFCISNGKL